MTPKVGIILINYKDYADRFLAECRDSLRLQTYPTDRFVVYVVDNVTTPETQARIAAIYPEAVVVPSPGNGWGHANNCGAARAFADGCNSVVLANMDTIFEPMWLAELVEVGERHDVGIAQSLMYLYPPHEGTVLLNSTGNLIHFLGFGFTRDYKVSVAECAYRDITDIGYAAGVAAYLRREVYEKICGCDEYYFMYHDDLELSLKVKVLGLRVVLAPKSIVHHKYEFGRSIRQVYFMERNRYFLLFTFFKWRTLLLIAPAIIMMDIGIWIFSFMGKWSRTKADVAIFFLKPATWREILARRKKLVAARTVSDRELVKDFVGRVEFQEIENPLLHYIGNPVLNAYWAVAKKLIWW